MGSNSLFERALSPRETLVFFAVAAFLFVYPLFLADNFYIDDSWRSQLAGTHWKEEGRLFVECFYGVLTFTAAAPNIFPLPLIIATLAMALALRRLAQHYFKTPNFSACLVVLPLWYSPYFLQNLSYQYDGPTMTLSLVAVIYAITFNSRHAVLNVLLPGALIALALGFYQLSLNVFIGLCCIEVVRQVAGGAPFKVVRWTVGHKAMQLLAGLVIYYLTAYPFMAEMRQGLLGLNPQIVGDLAARQTLVMERLGLLFNDGNRWFYMALAVGAGIAWLWAGMRAAASGQGLAQKVGLILLYGLSLPLLLLCVSGAALLFKVFNDGARTLMGLSALLVAMFYLNHWLLEKIHPRCCLLLLVPVLSMLSFSYAYGRVMSVQKELTNSVMQQLSYDIASRQELREAQKLYMVSIGVSGNWLPAASGSTRLMPALKYVLNINYFVLAEMLPRVGLVNVSGDKPPLTARSFAEGSFVPLVENKFYRLYALDGNGYIVMKHVDDAEVLRW
ncbi:glucosyltransferase domain-containing protein [Pseudomonas akapageensis]|uniref:glucosyltransferase domain-containing protein n=1 Tax=Pseudomonas akapageensis TaxID=2609961 RepID=UPI0014099FE8|nr:glucosyltransferase domain-containing protein [Pseudomonas akapageensis]